MKPLLGPTYNKSIIFEEIKMYMKRIHFLNMTKMYWLAIISLATILILMGTFEMIPFENKAYHTYLRILGFILIIVFYLKDIFYKNYVRWNNDKILIRLNSWSSTSISFKKISNFTIENDSLIILKKNGKTASFELTHFEQKDRLKLMEILEKFTLTTEK